VRGSIVFLPFSLPVGRQVGSSFGQSKEEQKEKAKRSPEPQGHSFGLPIPHALPVYHNSLQRTTQISKTSMCVGPKKRRGWGRPVRGSIVFFALFLVLLLGKQKKNKTKMNKNPQSTAFAFSIKHLVTRYQII
jgi:hypothetical protein